jgi:hypothetical protein
MERQKISKRPLPPRKLPSQCLQCGEINPWAVNELDISAPFGSTTHEFRAEMHQCGSCGAVSTTPAQLAAINEKVREAHRLWLVAQA